MLLSEMFGVEREVDFKVKGYESLFKVILNAWGEERLVFKYPPVTEWEPVPQGMLCSVIFAAPSGIIHLPPPLTDEQREQLKAIWTLGYRWLVKSKHCQVHAFEERPNKFEINYYWLSESGSVYYCSTKPSDCLAYLVSWSDPEPLDIGKALGVGE